MATEVQIAGTSDTAKIRNPLGVVGLSLITIGIYYFAWHYLVNKELSELGSARNTEELGDAPLQSLLATTLGFLLIVPPFVSIFRTCKRLNAAQHMTGESVGFNPVLGLLLAMFLGPVYLFLFQNSMNNVLENQGR